MAYTQLGPRSYTGGFNNMLLTLENAFLAARLTNRTLVVPPSRNERYNWLRIDAALDQEQLRHFWPCFIGSDEVRAASHPPAIRMKPGLVDSTVARYLSSPGNLNHDHQRQEFQ
jgi:hypothetical protein